ncbi:PLP-dependent aminotransferase family protein [Clostridium sp. cel8]|uniref:aminotransferase-like domain-containing protein n=1 Tax=Clostridium sp. cel8 TaxID=2663123 RepID=UPI0015F77840|nr:PLP-dependent aminotransferase family protein [Clostridium sp. cel8]MBA5850157.1 PLP-dependent aminotransferase family protein [Clostridium sp. cel8]
MQLDSVDNWVPDKSFKVPIYKQIFLHIRENILSGKLEIGSRLKSQREMAKDMNVNRSTVVEALEELKAEGLIDGRGSRGTIVVNNTWSLLTSIARPNWDSYIKYGIYKPNLHTVQMINKLEFRDDIVRLGTGELSPELFPHEMMKAVMNKVSSKIYSLGYEEPKGSFDLRKEISKYVKQLGINVSPNSILIVSGSIQAIQLISMGILQRGSSVITEKPSYLKSLHIFQSLGINLRGVSMDNYGIKIQELLNSINSNTKALYSIPTYHNPTGNVMPMFRRKELLSVCMENRLPIIEDDAYRELWIDKVPPPPLKSIDTTGTVLYIGTVSKSLAPGFRIGWIIGPEPVIERLGDIKMQTDYGASSISQLILTEWMSSGLYSKYVDLLRNKLKVRRKIVLDTLDRYFSDIAVWNRPSGGFYVWLKIKGNISMKRLFHIAYKNGILINPGSIYDFSKNSCIRISYSYASETDMKLSLKKLSEIIRSLM